MRTEGFKLTVAASLIVGTATGYISFLTGAGYFAILFRTAISVVALGLVGWMAFLVIDMGRQAPANPAASRSNLMDFVVGNGPSNMDGRRSYRPNAMSGDAFAEPSESESLAGSEGVERLRLAAEYIKE